MSPSFARASFAAASRLCASTLELLHPRDCLGRARRELQLALVELLGSRGQPLVAPVRGGELGFALVSTAFRAPPAASAPARAPAAQRRAAARAEPAILNDAAPLPLARAARPRPHGRRPPFDLLRRAASSFAFAVSSSSRRSSSRARVAMLAVGAVRGRRARLVLRETALARLDLRAGPSGSFSRDATSDSRCSSRSRDLVRLLPLLTRFLERRPCCSGLLLQLLHAGVQLACLIGELELPLVELARPSSHTLFALAGLGGRSPASRFASTFSRASSWTRACVAPFRLDELVSRSASFSFEGALPRPRPARFLLALLERA